MPHSKDYDGKEHKGNMTGFEDRSKSVPEREGAPRDRMKKTDTGGRKDASE